MELLVKDTLNILKVLAEESRLRIFAALYGQELCVCQIVALLGLAASTTSKHLALMYQAGLLDQRKDGRWAYYSTSDEWCRQNSNLVSWLLVEFKTSKKVNADAERLLEILAMPLDQLCQPQENCCPPDSGKTKRGKK